MKKLTILFVLLWSMGFSQTRDSLIYTQVKVSVTHDTTHAVTHDSTFVRVDTIKIDTLKRCLYINATSSIVGNKVKEDALISDLNKYKITQISLYSISTSSNPTAFANLIVRIKSETKVTSICPAVSSTSGINSWGNWNNTHSDIQDVDGLTLEYEAYNQTDVTAAWKLNCTFFQQMYALKKSGNMKCMNEYLGWWKVEPMITQTPDTVVYYFSINPNTLYLHDYRTTPDFSYLIKRLDNLNASGIEQKKVLRWKVLFSFEPDFLQPWLKSGHTVDEAFYIIYNAFKAKNYSNLILDGWSGFHLDYLRASQPTPSFTTSFAPSATPSKVIYSQSNFKNKTTRKNKRIAIEQ